MRELKPADTPRRLPQRYRRTLPRVRELKHLSGVVAKRLRGGRTLPRVRELKPSCAEDGSYVVCRRTIPRVRELKHSLPLMTSYYQVAPFPGCVN